MIKRDDKVMVTLTGEEILWIGILTGCTATLQPVNSRLYIKMAKLLSSNPTGRFTVDHSNNMVMCNKDIVALMNKTFNPPRDKTTIGGNTYYTDELELALSNIKPI